MKKDNLHALFALKSQVGIDKVAVLAPKTVFRHGSVRVGSINAIHPSFVNNARQRRQLDCLTLPSRSRTAESQSIHKAEKRQEELPQRIDPMLRTSSSPIAPPPELNPFELLRRWCFFGPGEAAFALANPAFGPNRLSGVVSFDGVFGFFVAPVLVACFAASLLMFSL